MSAGVVFTLDLEDRRSDERAAPRFLDATERVLAFLAERDVRGTFFVVGSLAREHPDIVRSVAAAGHEVGFHGLDHVMLAKSGRTALARELKQGKAILEDLTQERCFWFRAPYFSLVPETPWAPDVIQCAGFTYSSERPTSGQSGRGLPRSADAAIPLGEGLLELPCPVAKVGPLTLPYMGGAYMRLLPGTLVRALARRSSRDAVRWIYSHPYDFDPGEPFHVMPGTTRWESLLLWLNRRRMFDRVDTVLGHKASQPLIETVAELNPESTPIFHGRWAT